MASHQYRNLIAALGPYFHVVAPDYPGFGGSAMPNRDEYPYTFEQTSRVIEAFLERVGFTKFALYAHGYGAPVGFRIIQRRPEWLHWLIIQNTNAYEEGLASSGDLRAGYWKDRAPETEKALLGLLDISAIKSIYTHGHQDLHRICPDNWYMDAHFLERPGARQVQLDFFHDDRTNVALYPEWQAFLRKRQPQTLIFWGQQDIFFKPEGGEAYLRDLPDAEMHRLQSGHFALEDHLTTSRRRSLTSMNGSGRKRVAADAHRRRVRTHFVPAPVQAGGPPSARMTSHHESVSQPRAKRSSTSVKDALPRLLDAQTSVLVRISR